MGGVGVQLGREVASLVALHVAAWGMTNAPGSLSRTQAKEGAQTPGRQQLWPAPPRPQGTLWLPPRQLRPESTIDTERALS